MASAGATSSCRPTYGRRRGGEAGRSVNGTAVLADLFKRAGHRVTTIGRLSPTAEQVRHRRLGPQRLRTARPRSSASSSKTGWRAATNQTVDLCRPRLRRGRRLLGPDRARQLRRNRPTKRSAARPRPAPPRSRPARKCPPSEYARWFTARATASREQSSKLDRPMGRRDRRQPKPRFTSKAGSTFPQARPDRRSIRTLPRRASTSLLLGIGTRRRSITRITDDEDWSDGQVIVVTNGSFVLNYPLVNHEHRKLAAKLVAECGDGQNGRLHRKRTRRPDRSSTKSRPAACRRPWSCSRSGR